MIPETRARDLLLDAALEYAATYQLAVVPGHTISNGGCTCKRGAACPRPGKHPRIRGWGQRATREITTITDYWQKRFPGANINVPTGPRNGIAVLDVDADRGGDDTLAALERRHGILPVTVTSRTGGGGRHLIYRYPARAILSTQDTVGPGVDIRGRGGQIVVPPSQHASGKEYAWYPERGLGQVEIAPMPSWLVEQLTRPQRRPDLSRPASAPRARFDWTSVLHGVRQGQRHTAIFRMVCSLRGQGTPQPVAQELALHAARNCSPPLHLDEALGIVEDVFKRYPTNAERSMGLSSARIDILGTLSGALRPLPPAEVARELGKTRGAIKKLMAAMCRDGEIIRSDGGYILSSKTGRSIISAFPRPTRASRGHQSENTEVSGTSHWPLHAAQRR